MQMTEDDSIEKCAITPNMIQSLYSDDNEQQIAVVIQLRTLSEEEGQPIDDIIQNGIIPTLVEFLERDENPELQYNSAWTLTNVSGGTTLQTRSLIDANAVPALICLLSSAHRHVQEQAVWALGNIAGDCPEFRDHVLSHDVMSPLLQLFSNPEQFSVTALRTLINLCRGNPRPKIEEVSECLPLLAQLLFHENQEIILYACWVLSFLFDGTHETIELVVRSGVCRSLVELITHSNDQIVQAALRSVGYITAGNDEQTQRILNCNVLRAIRPLLVHPKEEMKKDACWIISNITAGSAQQIQAVIDADIVPRLIQILDNGEFATKQDALWAISNAIIFGNEDQLRSMVQQGCISPFCDLLVSTDMTVVEQCLSSLRSILFLGDLVSEKNGGLNPYAVMIKAHQGLSNMHTLQARINSNVPLEALCKYIMRRYFRNDVGENIVP